MTQLIPVIPAAGYIRMSTDKQEDSPERQRTEIERLAARTNHTIVAWYEDHGLTGTKSANRPDFQRMLADAKTGKFRSILVHDQSRFSREDFFDSFPHFKLLRKCGVKLVTSRGETDFDNVGGLIKVIIDQHAANAESVNKATQGLSGKVAKANRGIRSGRAPFGYDREILDQSGNVVRRVSYNERFQVAPGWTSRLVPAADIRQSEAAQETFRRFVEERASLLELARALNEAGYRTFRGKPFVVCDIRRLLSNPVYMGVFRFGHNATGSIINFRTANYDPIWKENNHPALVSRTRFEEAQRRLELIKRSMGTKAEARYLLSGLIVCDHCGRTMHGCHYKSASGTRTYENYCCRPPQSGLAGCDTSPVCRVEELEAIVLEVLSELFLTEEALPEILAALDSQPDDEPAVEDGQIAELERKVARGTENLALAEGENFRAISQLIEGWRADLVQLKERRRRRAHVRKNDGAEAVLAHLDLVRNEALSQGERPAVADFVGQAVQSISVGSRTAGEAEEIYGKIFLWPHTGAGKTSVPFKFRAKLKRKNGGLGHDRLARVAAAHGAPMSAADLSKALGVGKRCTYYHIEQALKRRQLVYAGQRGNTQLFAANPAADGQSPRRRKGRVPPA